MINKNIDNLKEQLIESVQRVLKIKSLEEEPKDNMPFGKGVNDALEEALKISEELGFKTKNIDGYAGYAEYGEGEEYVGVLGHLDVVPEGDGWKYPPYEGKIQDGKLWGRGALDDKGPIIAALYGLKAIKEANLPIGKKIRIIFGTNEETGCGDIGYYLSKEKPPIMAFTPDAEFPIIYAEKGIINFTLESTYNEEGSTKIIYIKGGERPNIVPDYCEALVQGVDRAILDTYIIKNRCTIEVEEKEEGTLIKSYGVSAHGSTPEKGKNAIMELILALNSLDIQGNLGEIIDTLANSIGCEVNGQGMNVGLSDEPSGKLTLNPGVINVDDKSFNLIIDIRYPVTFTGEEVLDRLQEKFKNSPMKIKNRVSVNPLYFSKEHELIKTLQKVYKKQTGDEPELLAIGGGTYAKAMPNTVAFGPTFPGKEDVIHKPNECVEIDELILMAKIYGNAIYELAK